MVKFERTLRSSRLSSQSLQGSVGSVQVAGSLSELRKLPGVLPRLSALGPLPVSEMGIDFGGLSSSSRLLGFATMKLSESTKSPAAAWDVCFVLMALTRLSEESCPRLEGIATCVSQYKPSGMAGTPAVVRKICSKTCVAVVPVTTASLQYCVNAYPHANMCWIAETDVHKFRCHDLDFLQSMSVARPQAVVAPVA